MTATRQLEYNNANSKRQLCIINNTNKHFYDIMLISYYYCCVDPRQSSVVAVHNNNTRSLYFSSNSLNAPLIDISTPLINRILERKVHFILLFFIPTFPFGRIIYIEIKSGVGGKK